MTTISVQTVLGYKQKHVANGLVNGADPEMAVLSRTEFVERLFWESVIKLHKGQQKTFRRRVGAWRIFFFRVPDEKRIVVSAIERRTSTTYRWG
jgi:hypothetical protein